MNVVAIGWTYTSNGSGTMILILMSAGETLGMWPLLKLKETVEIILRWILGKFACKL
jgi:hypothetical protein